MTRLLTLGHGTLADGVRRDGDLLAYDLGSTPPLPEA